MSTFPVGVSNLSNAIAIQEGFGASAGNLPTRSHNPGDIGNTGSATQGYSSDDAGYFALDSLVNSAGTTGTHSYSPNMTLAQFGAKYAADPNWATGVGGVLGVPLTTPIGAIVSGAVQTNMVPRRTGNGGTSAAFNTSSNQPMVKDQFSGVNDNDPAISVPVAGMAIPSELLSSINNVIYPPLITDPVGLQRVPWYADNDIMQVDGPTLAVGFPVEFQIYVQNSQAPLPITIVLNASIRTFQKSMHHIVNRQRTKTGFRINLWGMQPDQITGTASTGLFMNQSGVTDFLSLSNVSTQVQNEVIQAFSSNSTSPGQLNQVEANAALNDGFFRVAAKDAFVEFLSLFKMNGTTWFQSQTYTGYTTGTQQVATDVWSPQTGSTTAQNAARRMDVMTRGSVAMNFRSTTYFGYFKTLSWTMDAEHPYRWIFNFVFQVESTLVGVVVPTANTGVSNTPTTLNQMMKMGNQPQQNFPIP
jgi:hypothetical protein